MKTLAVFVLSFLVFSFPSFSQIKRCYTYENLQKFKSKNPNAETDAQFESWLNKRIAERKILNGRTTLSTYTIPVIFHVVHNGEAVGTGTNISAALINAQLQQLNTDFANGSGSTYSVAASAGIQFTMAVIGADGKKLAEPGIERIDRNSRGWQAAPYDAINDTYVDDVIMPNTIWNPNKYMNLWVLDLGSTLLGRASFPASSTIPDMVYSEDNNHAGIILHSYSVGSKAMPGAYGAGAGLGRTLSHEAGHFFGLRHIWGDQNDCSGNDYCNDTPPQAGYTSGCPTAGTMNGCTTPVAKMFENYMDYTSDNCVNTFTTDQVARMQTVMTNSPRRKELATSTVATAPAANVVQFSAASATIRETAAAAACPGYKDVTVSLNVFDAATGDATITVTKGGTATEGKDYELSASTATFTNGDGASKTFTIRVWDDGITESTETVVLNYSISGTGVVAGTESQTFTITISDDDVAPVINNNITYLLNESFGTSGGTFPASWRYGSFISPAGVNNWVVSSNGGTGFSGQAAHITNDAVAKPNGYSDVSKTDVILISRQIDARGYSNLNLSFKYKVAGEADVDGIYDFGTLMYSLDGSTFDILPNAADNNNPYFLQGKTEAASFTAFLSALSNTTFYLGFRWINDDNIGNQPGFTIDDVMVTGDAAKVESDITQSGTENIFAAQEVFILSGNDNQVLAKIKNASADVGCVTASVAQAGTGTAGITTTAGSFLRTQKVIQLSPAAATANTTYEATLYFSAAELATWGSNKTALKILKVKDGVDLNGTITSSDAAVITPTNVFEDIAGGYIAYTGNFTGFSQFMLVSPTFVLPINLVQFEAKPVKSSIQLSWQTEATKENKGFTIERSSNGKDFSAVGYINGNKAFFSFTDYAVQPNTVYYYRLQEKDETGRSNYSAIRQAKVSGIGISLKAAPNPATDKISVFVSGSSGLANIKLVDANGRVVGSWRHVNVTSVPFSIPVQALPQGIYSLVVALPDVILTEKVIKQ